MIYDIFIHFQIYTGNMKCIIQNVSKIDVSRLLMSIFVNINILFTKNKKMNGNMNIINEFFNYVLTNMNLLTISC